MSDSSSPDRFSSKVPSTHSSSTKACQANTSSKTLPAAADKWNKRYAQASEANAAARVLQDNLHLLPTAGKALELACGLGGNALLLAEQGLEVEAWDLSPVAITKLTDFARQRQLTLSTQVRDLDQHRLPPNAYDVICVSGFLDRSLCPAIIAALKPNGLLFYQTFSQLKVNTSGPSNPVFLLDTGELLALFGALSIVAYREEADNGDIEQGLRNQAYLVARKLC